MNLIKIHPDDNVAVALEQLNCKETYSEGGTGITALEDIPRGHKIALRDIPCGSRIIKYGNPIAIATKDITAGSWVHTHNVRTGLSEDGDYSYNHQVFSLPDIQKKTFQGYRRTDGKVGIRNEIWVLPIVGCINGVAKTLVEENQDLVTGSIDGLYYFAHPFGCSQLGDDLAMTKRVLADLVHHPNAGAVLCVGLGCENLVLDMFQIGRAHV